MIEPVERWIVCITGFMQPEGRVTGVESLQDELHRLCLCRSTRVILKSWRDSAYHVAERIWNRRPQNKQLHVVLIGYSWGGYTAVKLAWELRKRGLEVESLILSDAVWRSKTPIFYPLSMVNYFPIHIPDNVHTLYTWRQVSNRPRGAEIKLQDKDVTKWITNRVHDDIDHQYMDDDDEFLRIAKEVACPKLAVA